MHEAIHDNHCRVKAVRRGWRMAILATLGGLAMAALAWPTGLERDGFVFDRALAASAHSNAGGHGQGRGPEEAPGQQQPDVADTEPADAQDAVHDVRDSHDPVEEPAVLQIAEDEPANANVIKEIAGLAGDEELSEEEEQEVIRNGWGTWRTADGPETVTSQ